MENKYELKTLKDIIDILNEDNIDNFLIDFKTWLSIQLVSKRIAELEGVVLDSPLGIFRWIDDGKNEVNINLNMKVKNSDISKEEK